MPKNRDAQKGFESAVPEAVASAIVFGRSMDVVQSLAEELRYHDLSVTVAGFREAELFDATTADASIVVIDRLIVESLFHDVDFGRTRQRVRSLENRVRNIVTDTALRAGAHRLLVVCDARRTSTSERRRAARWLCDVVQRAQYECSINGLQVAAIAYAVIDGDRDVARVAQSVARWHRARPAA